MVEISAKLVNELRAVTGAGLMDCKRALEESQGDIERAKEILRIKGKTIAEKKSGRTANEGLAYTWVSDDYSKALMFELNCETDFVARNEDFRNLAEEIALAIRKSPLMSETQLITDSNTLASIPAKDNSSVGDLITDAVQRIRENIQLSRCAILSLSADEDVVNSYVHLDGKIGVLVGIKAGVRTPENLPALLQLAKDLCLQIAATDPIAISREDVPAEVLEREKRVIREQTLAEGKPENLIDKIVEGRLNKFYQESVLLEQEFVKEEKRKVKQVIEAMDKTIGVSPTIVKFFRFQVGAG